MLHHPCFFGVAWSLAFSSDATEKIWHIAILGTSNWGEARSNLERRHRFSSIAWKGMCSLSAEVIHLTLLLLLLVKFLNDYLPGNKKEVIILCWHKIIAKIEFTFYYCGLSPLCLTFLGSSSHLPFSVWLSPWCCWDFPASEQHIKTEMSPCDVTARLIFLLFSTSCCGIELHVIGK